MAFIYREFLESICTKQDVCIYFFIHGRGTELQKTPTGMSGSLVSVIYEGAFDPIGSAQSL